MCPVLRGEVPPLPPRELAELRDKLERTWGHTSIPTPSGPLLAVRVPTEEPDLLQDLETATDHLPPLELSGYRGAILVGDRAHLGVSIDMLHSLVDSRREVEAGWLAGHRKRLMSWEFQITRLPSDAERRLRAVIRVAVTRVAEMGEREFDELAEILPRVKAASPGQCRPAFAYLIAHEDHVRIEGGRFFSELERRAQRIQERRNNAAKQKREESYEIARGHIARIEEQNKRSSSRPHERRTSAHRYRREPRAVAPEPRPARTEPRSTRHRHEAPASQEVAREPRAPSPRHETGPRGPSPQAPAPPRRASADSRFLAAERHAGQVDHLKKLLQEAGYETRHRLVVDEVPLALAAARPEGYPRRVLVSFHQRLGPDEARRILRVTRGAGAELAVVVAEQIEEGVDRVTLATNLKVIAPEAVMGLRLD